MTKEQRLRRLIWSLLGVLPMLLLVGYFGASRLQVTSAASGNESQSIEDICSKYTSPISVTMAYTVHLPIAFRNCQMMLADDFSTPIYDWPVGETVFGEAYYDQGAYWMVDDKIGLTLFGGLSPDWIVPNDAAIKVDTWIVDAPSGSGINPAHSLVFGLQLQPSPFSDELLWIDWYEFRVSPQTQYYRVWKWRNMGDTFDVLTSGYSSAILPELDAVQTLEVRRDGNAITLMVNDTVLETVVDSTNPYDGRRSVGVGAGDFYLVGFDNFEVRASGCITTPVTSAVTSWSID